jgi:mono/diheme cytochrome c family protein
VTNPTPNGPQAREQLEPSDLESSGRFVPIPSPFLAFMAILTVISFGYIVRYANDLGFAGDRRTPGALATVSKKGGAAGDQVFASLCAGCHQATGLGLPGVFPPLAGSEWVRAQENTAAKILLAGLSGSVTVKGQTYNGQMPAFKQLSDDEIAAVLTYLRSSWGNSAPEVTAASVKSVRESLKDRSEPWKGEAELGRPQ